jgi:alpha-ketoglutarate-dependent taurine dioxygenase
MDEAETVQESAMVPAEALRGWQRATLEREEWFRPFPQPCLAELRATARILDRNPLETVALDLPDYPLDTTRAFMKGIKATLTDGCGFVVLDKLPTDELSRDRAKQLYWLLSSMIARPVAQAFKGTMLYDVRDLGLAQSATVRGDLTNEELNWHSDYGYNCPPPFIGLLVLRTARSGGVSSVASFEAVHKALGERRPDLLRRLYEPFIWNRAREHAPDEPLTTRLPVFQIENGRLRARYNPFMIHNGHRIAEEPLDERGKAALEALGAIMSEPEMHCEFVLEPGQIEYLGNWRGVHRRTTYEDWDDEERKRHLVRIFLRDFGRRSFNG